MVFDKIGNDGRCFGVSGVDGRGQAAQWAFLSALKGTSEAFLAERMAATESDRFVKQIEADGAFKVFGQGGGRRRGRRGWCNGWGGRDGVLVLFVHQHFFADLIGHVHRSGGQCNLATFGRAVFGFFGFVGGAIDGRSFLLTVPTCFGEVGQGLVHGVWVSRGVWK